MPAALMIMNSQLVKPSMLKLCCLNCWPGVTSPARAGVSCLPPTITFSWVLRWQPEQMNRSSPRSSPTHFMWCCRPHTQQLKQYSL